MLLKEYQNARLADRKALGKNAEHLKAYLSLPGYRIMTHFRRCQYLKGKKWLIPLYFLERLIYHRMCVKFSCDIPSNTEIGPGFVIKHPVGIVINSHAVIGSDCSIRTGALIGGSRTGVPVIGDHVSIGGHSIVLGGITVGDNSDIGAGAIVTHDVPRNAVVICESAHVHRIKEE